MKKSRQQYDLDYKRRIVAEYLAGMTSAEEIARREGPVRGQIYKWRVQLERRQRAERIEAIAETDRPCWKSTFLKNFSPALRSRAYRVGTSTPSGSWLG